MRVEAGYLVAAAAVSVFAIAPAMVPELNGRDFLDPRILPCAVAFGVVWAGCSLGGVLESVAAVAVVATAGELVGGCGLI